MSDLNIHPSPEFLNELDWQSRRLSLLIETMEGLVVSIRDLHKVLSTLLKNERARDVFR